MKDFIDLHPLVPIALSLVIGIVIGEFAYGVISTTTLYTLLIITITLTGVTYLIRRFKRLNGFLLLLVCTSFGMLLAVKATDDVTISYSNDYETFDGVVVSTPVKKATTVSADMLVVGGRLGGKTLRLAISKDTNSEKLRVGASLRVRAKVRHPLSFANSKFDYSKYLACHGISAVARVYEDKWDYQSLDNSRLPTTVKMRIVFLTYRDRLIEQLRRQGFDGQVLAVVAAMSLGDKSEVSRATTDIYSITGASHILALSGLHLSIVFGLFAVFGSRWRRSLPIVLLMLMMIWSYVLLAGMPVSMIRSAVMLSVTIVVGLANRNGMTLNSLAFAAILILLANPLAVHDVGFQLSFMAVAFIAGFAGGAYNIIPMDILIKHRILRWCWQLCITSTLAQLGTSPLVIFHFGRFPVYFLLTNFVAIPAATAILYLAVALFAFSFVPAVVGVISFCLFWTAATLNLYLTKISTLPFASVNIADVEIYEVVYAYILMLVLLYPLRNNMQIADKRYDSLAGYISFLRLKRKLTSRH